MDLAIPPPAACQKHVHHRIWNLAPAESEHLSRCSSPGLPRIRFCNRRLTGKGVQIHRNCRSPHISRTQSFSLNSQGNTASAIDLSDDPVTNWPISVNFQSQGYQLSLVLGIKKQLNRETLRLVPFTEGRGSSIIL